VEERTPAGNPSQVLTISTLELSDLAKIPG
jgi:hypothetical protein